LLRPVIRSSADKRGRAIQGSRLQAAASPAVSRLKRKEGRIPQADPRTQAVSRLSRPDKEEDPRRNSGFTATSPRRTNKSGSQRPGH